MKYFKVIILFIVIFSLITTLASADESFVFKKEISEDQTLTINILPGQQFEVVFKPKKIGTWDVNVFHDTKLLSNECGEVYFAIAENEKDDRINIVLDKQVCYMENNKVSLVSKDNIGCFRILITQKKNLIMSVKVRVSFISGIELQEATEILAEGG